MLRLALSFAAVAGLPRQKAEQLGSTDDADALGGVIGDLRSGGGGRLTAGVQLLVASSLTSPLHPPCGLSSRPIGTFPPPYADKRRGRALTALGWRVLRLDPALVMSDLAAVVALVQQAMV